MNILYRKGKIEDCSKIAEGIDRASGGIVAFLFHDLFNDSSAADVMADFLRDGVGYESYENAIVAECEGEIVGIVYSYPSKHHGITDEAREFFPQDRLDFLGDFFNSRVENSLFLDSIYVDEKFRGQGVGSKLIALTKEKAKENGYQQLSLMVMNENITARRAYERNQFQIVKHIDVKEHPLIPNKGGIYLLVSDVDK
ncbi:GNAT family N-acetyltransferase [Pelosinus sp. sgz500959]|uniref:GNAT family N-acetyltransferase n=1 Tax=Pelosinus sp. sgz500959 TaxID=3242472 RepID=UPI00366D5D29